MTTIRKSLQPWRARLSILLTPWPQGCDASAEETASRIRPRVPPEMDGRATLHVGSSRALRAPSGTASIAGVGDARTISGSAVGVIGTFALSAGVLTRTNAGQASSYYAPLLQGSGSPRIYHWESAEMATMTGYAGAPKTSLRGPSPPRPDQVTILRPSVHIDSS